MQRELAISDEKSFFVLNGFLTTLALCVLTYVLVLRHGHQAAVTRPALVPGIDAALNATAAALLIAGFVAIRRGAWRVHRALMLSAFGVSCVFLVSYVSYHAQHGETHFRGSGLARALYLSILTPHILLSMTIPPLALSALFFAYRAEFTRHKRITRWLLPIWLFVSVTGVLIFLMLRSSYGA